MSAMTTTLSEFTNNGNSVTYMAPGHTLALPRLVVQKRKVAATAAIVAEDAIRVAFGSHDAADAPLPTKCSVEVIVRRLPSAQADDMAAAVALFLDIVNSTNFANVVTSQSWLKS